MTPKQTSLPDIPAGERLAALIKEQRSFLLRLACLQLGDLGAAEDAVQEATIAAWQTLDRFEGRSSLRTWLISILRFKVLDALRDRKRQSISFSAIEFESELEGLQDELLFDAEGQWLEMPNGQWLSTEEDEQSNETPEGSFAQKQLLTVLEACLENLPPKTARVFLMREYLGCESEDIARELGLQAGNVRVILLRARLALRTCLDQRMGGQSNVQGRSHNPQEVMAT